MFPSLDAAKEAVEHAIKDTQMTLAKAEITGRLIGYYTFMIDCGSTTDSLGNVTEKRFSIAVAYEDSVVEISNMIAGKLYQ